MHAREAADSVNRKGPALDTRPSLRGLCLDNDASPMTVDTPGTPRAPANARFLCDPAASQSHQQQRVAESYNSPSNEPLLQRYRTSIPAFSPMHTHPQGWPYVHSSGQGSSAPPPLFKPPNSGAMRGSGEERLSAALRAAAGMQPGDMSFGASSSTPSGFVDPLPVQPASSMDRMFMGLHPQSSLMLMPTMSNVRALQGASPRTVQAYNNIFHPAPFGQDGDAYRRQDSSPRMQPHAWREVAPVSPLTAFNREVAFNREAALSREAARQAMCTTPGPGQGVQVRTSMHVLRPNSTPDLQRGQGSGMHSSVGELPLHLSLDTAPKRGAIAARASQGRRPVAIKAEETQGLVECTRQDALERLVNVPLCTRRKVDKASSKLRGVTKCAPDISTTAALA